MQHRDEADGAGAVEGEEPEGEGLRGGEVEEVGALVEDFVRVSLVPMGLGLGRGEVPVDSISMSMRGLRILYHL